KQLLYLKPADHALSDAAVFMYSFDKMIYDLLYQQSWRFRLRHWGRLITSRPRLMAAKVLLKVTRGLTGALMPKSKPQPALIRWLEEQVATKQEEPLARFAQENGLRFPD